MHLGAFLVILGLVLVVLSFALGVVPRVHNSPASNPLLQLGVLCIGVGVLIGRTTLETR